MEVGGPVLGVETSVRVTAIHSARSVSQIDQKWEPLGARACLAWALVHRVRWWRAMWLSKRGAGERHVRGFLCVSELRSVASGGLP